MSLVRRDSTINTTPADNENSTNLALCRGSEAIPMFEAVACGNGTAQADR